jgi:hypothetical protein
MNENFRCLLPAIERNSWLQLLGRVPLLVQLPLMGDSLLLMMVQVLLMDQFLLQLSQVPLSG